MDCVKGQLLGHENVNFFSIRLTAVTDDLFTSSTRHTGMGADTINTINTILCELTWQKFYFILISMRGRTINLTYQRFWRISDGEIKNCPCSNLFYAPSLWVWPLESALSLRGIRSTGFFQCWLFSSPIDINKTFCYQCRHPVTSCVPNLMVANNKSRTSLAK